MATMMINGHRLNVEQYGSHSDTAVILLHHGLGSTLAWKAQIDDLEKAGYYTIAYDRWGYGRSEARAGLGIPDFLDDRSDLMQLIDSLKINRVHLVGHSDGGTISLYFASDYPDRVGSLVTVAAHIYIEPDMGKGILGIKQAYQSERSFRKGLERIHGEKSDQVFENWFDGWYQQRVMSWDMTSKIAAISCPSWIVQGELDEHARTKHAQDIAAAIQGAQLWLVPGAGHMVPQEQSDVFNHRLLAFLRSVKE